MTEFPEIPRNQRVVVRFASGLYSIIGHTDAFNGQTPPSTTLATFSDGRIGPIDLVASKPRYLLYKEPMAPAGLGTFDKAQR